MSRQDFLRIAEARFRATPGLSLDPASVRKPGSTLNAVYNGVSAVGEELDRRSAARFAALLSGSARDGDLDALVADRTFGRVLRKGAAAATVELGVARAGTGAAATVPAGAEVSVGGADFVLDPPGVSFASGEGGPGLVKRAAFTAKLAGLAGNVLALAPAFKNPASLPAGVSVSALADEPQASGGAEREADPELLDRYRRFTAGLERNLLFLEAGALQAPGVQAAAAIEELSPEGLLTGRVILHVADANGRAGKALRARVVATLRDYRLLGQRVQVESALPSLEPVVAQVGVLAGFQVGDVQTRARGALVASVNALPPGANLLRAQLAAALAAVPGVVLLPSVPFGVTVPAADRIAAPSTRFRTSPELVTFL
ncbi:MAG TPA: baseplate J/gp47 family protein [Polyangiaceae bacterium]|nr:baseplate J/gp47 family protein [Polyangiaceae bacterium]